MCGIFALLNNRDSYSSEIVTNAFETGSKRGPDKSTFTTNENIILGFHRLAAEVTRFVLYGILLYNEAWVRFLQ